MLEADFFSPIPFLFPFVSGLLVSLHLRKAVEIDLPPLMALLHLMLPVAGTTSGRALRAGLLGIGFLIRAEWDNVCQTSFLCRSGSVTTQKQSLVRQKSRSPSVPSRRQGEAEAISKNLPERERSSSTEPAQRGRSTSPRESREKREVI